MYRLKVLAAGSGSSSRKAGLPPGSKRHRHQLLAALGSIVTGVSYVAYDSEVAAFVDDHDDHEMMVQDQKDGSYFSSTSPTTTVLGRVGLVGGRGPFSSTSRYYSHCQQRQEGKQLDRIRPVLDVSHAVKKTSDEYYYDGIPTTTTATTTSGDVSADESAETSSTEEEEGVVAGTTFSSSVTATSASAASLTTINPSITTAVMKVKNRISPIPKNDADDEALVSSSNTSSNSSTTNSLFRLEDVYDIQEVLGEGGYGLVYKAVRKLDGEIVAVKSMSRELTGKTDFEREVAALQLLSKKKKSKSLSSTTTTTTTKTTPAMVVPVVASPTATQVEDEEEGHEGHHHLGTIISGPQNHIVQLYDLHRDDDNYYLVMEYVHGKELLQHLIDYGPYSEGLASSFLRQFAEAIHYIHNQCGLTHADLKPENLLLSTTTTSTTTSTTNTNRSLNFDDDDDYNNLNLNINDAKLKIVDFGCAQTHDLSHNEMYLPFHEFAKGCSFLHMVALGNQFELTKLLLQQKDPNTLINFRDYDYRTPLHLAASEGHVDICRFLVEKGAIINRNDRWGGTPLDDAYRHHHVDVIAYLKDNNATFGTQTTLPRFIQAASEGDVEEVKALLEFGTIDLDHGDYDHRTALHLAAGEGQYEIVELLCMAGANPNVEDRWGNHPIDDAVNAKKNSIRIMKLLLEYGGTSTKDPTLVDRVQQMKDDIVNEEKDNISTKSHDGSDDGSAPHRANTLLRRKQKEGSEIISGTISYWPPELFLDGAVPTPASDMWAVGAIMFVVLTGT